MSNEWPIRILETVMFIAFIAVLGLSVVAIDTVLR